MVVYATLVALLITLLVDTSLSVAKMQKESFVYFNLNSAAMTAFSRFSRDIKRAASIDLVRSIINTHPGKLILQIRKPDGTYDETSFYMRGDVVATDFNGAYLGDLTPDGIVVSNLTFKPFDTASSSAVRVEMTVRPRDTSLIAALNFYGTYTLRGSYIE
jgi:hypothetical protein